MARTTKNRRSATSPARQHEIGERQRLHELAQVLELEKDQLRGVPIPTLLARAARLYARNGAAAREAPAETFALSHAVGRLDFFISHAWRSPRLAKYLALCRYFNGHLAVHAALLGCFLTFFWALHRAPIPGELMVQFPNRIDKGGVLTFPMAAFNWHHVSFFAYLATAALAHQLLRRRQTAFLDIACVNQLDDTSKALGIQRLGAVLQRTERMLVLADEHYWKRLWCVFEVAAFCRHANASRLVILPLHSPMIELGMGVFFHLALSVVFFKGLVITGSMDPNSAAFQTYVRNWLIGAAFLVQPFIILPILSGQRSRRALRALRDFSIADAQCYSAEDRAALVAVICSWYTDYQAGEVDPERLQQLGQHKFETFVRHDLAPAIERQQAGEAARVGFICAVHSLLPALLVANTSDESTVIHMALALVYLTAILAAVFPFVVLWYEAITSATGRLIEDGISRLSSPAMRRLLTAVTCAICLPITAAALPLCSVLLGAVRLNVHLSPDWRIPADDGFDTETRRYLKHFMVLAYYYMLFMIVDFRSSSR